MELRTGMLEGMGIMEWVNRMFHYIMHKIFKNKKKVIQVLSVFLSVPFVLLSVCPLVVIDSSEALLHPKDNSTLKERESAHDVAVRNAQSRISLWEETP